MGRHLACFVLLPTLYTCFPLLVFSRCDDDDDDDDDGDNDDDCGGGGGDGGGGGGDGGDDDGGGGGGDGDDDGGGGGGDDDDGGGDDDDDDDDDDSGGDGGDANLAEPRGEEEAEGADRHNVKPPQHLPSLTSRQDTARGTPLPKHHPHSTPRQTKYQHVDSETTTTTSSARSVSCSRLRSRLLSLSREAHNTHNEAAEYTSQPAIEPSHPR
ncbi:hypothetical protein Pcinc_017053 [Petrolisthes cinctipes]|uniref:Uncharacterized protein n=1 Tax=Petrolisthes cinctipes TaxID=88211 RepID=A0AAE1FPU0_PETCI|nr:hypothetical protein Pcinc_017053 [Petrolisthes cinctipes]